MKECLFFQKDGKESDIIFDCISSKKCYIKSLCSLKERTSIAWEMQNIAVTTWWDKDPHRSVTRKIEGWIWICIRDKSCGSTRLKNNHYDDK